MASTETQKEVDLLAELKKALKYLVSGDNFEKIFSEVEIKEASPGHVICELKVCPHHLNKAGNVYGGFLSCLTDFTTSAACWATERRKIGVTTNLSTSFIGAAKLGDVLKLDAKCNKIGNTLAFLQLTITNQDGKLIATGNHTKLVNGPY